jgi:hypothetical protein
MSKAAVIAVGVASYSAAVMLLVGLALWSTPARADELSDQYQAAASLINPLGDKCIKEHEGHERDCVYLVKVKLYIAILYHEERERQKGRKP